jgi:hypothetical protein
MLIKKIECDCCGRVFHVCRKCYRGQKYCSKECQKAGYLETHREARQYSQTDEGKERRRDAQIRRRDEKKEGGVKKGMGLLQKVYKSCMCLYMLIESMFSKDEEYENSQCCDFCGSSGVVVDAFPRRSYGVCRCEEKIDYKIKVLTLITS